MKFILGYSPNRETVDSKSFNESFEYEKVDIDKHNQRIINVGYDFIGYNPYTLLFDMDYTFSGYGDDSDIAIYDHLKSLILPRLRECKIDQII
jgi:hypothetical protein